MATTTTWLYAITILIQHCILHFWKNIFITAISAAILIHLLPDKFLKNFHVTSVGNPPQYLQPRGFPGLWASHLKIPCCLAKTFSLKISMRNYEKINTTVFLQRRIASYAIVSCGTKFQHGINICFHFFQAVRR